MDKPKVNVGDLLHLDALGMSGLVLLSAVGEGMSRVHQKAYKRVVDRLYRGGETKDSLLRQTEALPIPPQLKDAIAKHVEALSEGQSGIEIEVTVEEV